MTTLTKMESVNSSY